MPFYRDILLALGVCSVSKQSCSNILKSGPGSAITIVVGGAAESLSARPGTADLTLRKRCVLFSPGALKIDVNVGCDMQIGIYQARDSTWVRWNSFFPSSVMMHTFIDSWTSFFIFRADLVPVFSFGENDVRLIYLRDCLWRLTGCIFRFMSKCLTKKEQRYMPCNVNSSRYLDSLYLSSMDEDCWIVCYILFFFCKGNPTFDLDNLGLMPYRRQIIAVSELRITTWLFLNGPCDWHRHCF